MHTRLTSDNPHRYNRYGFAWHHVRKGESAHLDFGCGDGSFLATLKRKGIGRLVGVDVCREAVEKAGRQLTDVEIVHIAQAQPLPFGNGEFGSISALDVIEHVDRQVAVLAELNRILQAGGALIVTVPGRHVFSFLDAGNLKFCFPRLHRWYYCRKHSKAEYEHRYVSNPDGLVGDVSARKRWHEHFSRSKLEGLLNRCGFAVVQFDGAGLFNRVLKNIGFLSRRLKVVQSFVRRLEALDAKAFESANLFCVARKREMIEDGKVRDVQAG